jgi:hypothetical protein
MMAPLIDEELQKVDRTIASLNAINSQLVEAMNLYHTLMKESLPVSSYPYTDPLMYQMQQHAMATSGQPMMQSYMGQPAGGIHQPVTSNMPAYSSPQHVHHPQQQYAGPPIQQHQQPPVSSGYVSQFPAVHSMHHQQIPAASPVTSVSQPQQPQQQQQMTPQLQQEYAYHQQQQQQQPAHVPSAFIPYAGSQMPQQ